MNSQIHKINRNLITGWLVIVGVLFVSYCGEVIKGERTLQYLVLFMLVTSVPAFFCLYLYRKKPDRFELRYFIVVGYFMMYLFSMMTGSTSMVFSYILPMLSLLVLYHQPKLILFTGIASGVVNLISIGIKFYTGEMNLSNSKDGEIQIALLFLCFAGSYLAAKLYDEITLQNIGYLKMVDDKNRQIRKMSLQTIATIANTIDAKDEYTRGHSRRVSEYSMAIARELGFEEKEVLNIRSVALLHDIGKIGVPDSVLNKPGRLTQEEYQLMKQHTVIGSEILKDIVMIPGIDVGAKYHHERYDGTGYPDGLAGEEIPLIARIIAVADAYDAMTSNRVYRQHLDEQKVMDELVEGIGKQFDPLAGGAMIRLIQEGRIHNISPDMEDSQVETDMSTILSRVMEKQGKQLLDEALLDKLTDTYNRSYGEKMIRLAMEQTRGCLMLFDMDHFRIMNDNYGFVLGDICIKVVAENLKKLEGDKIIARFGGDEFVVFIRDITTEEQAEKRVKSFQEYLRRKIHEEKSLRGLTVSVGIAFSHNNDDFPALLLRADKAIYLAKQQGGNKYCFYQQTAIPVNEMKVSGVDLNQLVRMLRNDNYYEGGFQLTYPEFGKIYEFVKKTADRNNQQIQILMLTMTSDGDIDLSVEEREKAMSFMERAVISSIRSVDVTTRYSSTQRIVLLTNLDKEQIGIVTERIMKEFYRMCGYKGVSIHYDVADLSES